MDLEWHPEAAEEFLEMDEDIQKAIERDITKLPEKGLGWSKVKLINRPSIGFSCYRLKTDPEERPDVNHRALFKVEDDRYHILKVGKRPGFYNPENLESARRREE